MLRLQELSQNENCMEVRGANYPLTGWDKQNHSFVSAGVLHQFHTWSVWTLYIHHAGALT